MSICFAINNIIQKLTLEMHMRAPIFQFQHLVSIAFDSVRDCLFK